MSVFCLQPKPLKISLNDDYLSGARERGRSNHIPTSPSRNYQESNLDNINENSNEEDTTEEEEQAQGTASQIQINILIDQLVS